MIYSQKPGEVASCMEYTCRFFEGDISMQTSVSWIHNNGISRVEDRDSFADLSWSTDCACFSVGGVGWQTIQDSVCR